LGRERNLLLGVFVDLVAGGAFGEVPGFELGGSEFFIRLRGYGDGQTDAGQEQARRRAACEHSVRVSDGASAVNRKPWRTCDGRSNGVGCAGASYAGER